MGERVYIDKSLFSGVTEEMEKVILASQSEEVPEICCSFKQWTGGQGLKDQATVNCLSNLVAGVCMDGLKFRD